MRAVPGYCADEDMPLEKRQKQMQEIQERRDGRKLIVLANWDRVTDSGIPGIQTQFSAEVKEPLYRVLKETVGDQDGVDLLLYTRGGDTNAVWPLVSLLREFDPNFQVLVPFRCHSSGTLLALAAERIVMSAIGELSPIDPTTGNQFNPVDPVDKKARLGISVEDVQAYREFILEQFKFADAKKADHDAEAAREILRPFVDRLTDRVHPLALGNVHRVHQQIKKLADKLLSFHDEDQERRQETVEALATRFYSHLHMITREEATEILGDKIVFAEGELASVVDKLLRGYEVHFFLRRAFHLAPFVGDLPKTDARFIGGLVESVNWSYLYETQAVIYQHSAFPENVQVQVPAGQSMPLVPGLPRTIRVEVGSQGWVRNTKPRGFSR
jgi:hypothetical protein